MEQILRHYTSHMTQLIEFFEISILFGVFWITSGLLCLKWPQTDTGPNRLVREPQLDGLRALLSFGVVVWHMYYIRNGIFTGIYDFVPQSKVTALLGEWTVPMFFAITGYLFSSRCIEYARNGLAGWIVFFVNRLFRLVPAAFLTAFVLFILFAPRIFTVASTKNIAQSLVNFINLSMSSLVNPASGPVGAALDSWEWMAAAGSHWTLHFEWIFYISLPLLALPLTKKRIPITAITAVLVLWLVLGNVKTFIFQWDYVTWAFVPGIILGLCKPILSRFESVASHLVFGMICVISVLLQARYPFLKLKIPSNFLFLYAVLSQNKFTDILGSKTMRFIGESTYSIYLLHGPVLFVTHKWLLPSHKAVELGEAFYWLSCCLQMIVIVFLGCVSSQYVEKTGINIGKRVLALPALSRIIENLRKLPIS